MPSSKIKPPSYYPAHWHRCLEWLAGQPQGKKAEITLAEGREQRASVQTTATKVYAFRRSLLLYPGFSRPEVFDMLKSREVTVKIVGDNVVAVRNPALSLFAAAALEHVAKNSSK